MIIIKIATFETFGRCVFLGEDFLAARQVILADRHLFEIELIPSLGGSKFETLFED